MNFIKIIRNKKMLFSIFLNSFLFTQLEHKTLWNLGSGRVEWVRNLVVSLL